MSEIVIWQILSINIDLKCGGEKMKVTIKEMNELLAKSNSTKIEEMIVDKQEAIKMLLNL